MEADGEKSVQLDASFPGKDKSDLLALEPIRLRELQPVRMEFAGTEYHGVSPPDGTSGGLNMVKMRGSP